MKMDPAVTGAFMAAAAQVAAPTRVEDGCLAYHFSLDELEPGLAHVYEAWEDEDSLNLHLQTAHVAAFRAALTDLGERTTDVMLYAVTPLGRPGVARS